MLFKDACEGKEGGGCGCFVGDVCLIGGGVGRLCSGSLEGT